MKTILLVEDMKGVRDSLEVILTQSYALDCADSADAGLSLVKTKSYDLIITDIIMPGMDGNEFMIQLKKLCNSPILAISAGGNGASPDQALMLAKQLAEDILEKPFSKETLLQKIESMIM